jgi:hypothetical protein
MNNKIIKKGKNKTNYQLKQPDSKIENVKCHILEIIEQFLQSK